MKFTDRTIQSLKAKDKRYIAWKINGDGLGVRVSTKGKKTFIYMYRFDGANRMMTLGPYPKISLVKANTLHAQAIALLEKGEDPAKQHIEKKVKERKAFTIDGLANEYIERWAKKHKRSWKADLRTLEADILPHWKNKKAKSINRHDIVTLLDSIVDRGSPIQANRTLALLRKMFNFAVSRGIIEYSVCIGITMPAVEKQRDRILTEEEIKQFWFNLEGDKIKMHESTKIALKLVLVTAQRVGEVAKAEYSEFDLDNKWWTIPAKKAKNKLPHRVPLSDLAIILIEEARKFSGESNYVFPSPRGGGVNHINPKALARAVNNNSEHLEIDNLIPYDLRRTAASLITGMGISRLVVSKILNHVESGVTAVYDRHSYDKEKRHALDAWGAELGRILGKKESANVVPMRVG